MTAQKSIDLAQIGTRLPQSSAHDLFAKIDSEVRAMSKRTNTLDDAAASKKAIGRRYVPGGTVPRTVAVDRILLHNHVRHTKDMPCGVNGFRAWTQRKGTQGSFKKCNCGWAGLPHYANPNVVNYRCETVSWEELEVMDDEALAARQQGANIAKDQQIAPDTALDGALCDRLADGLVRLLKHSDPLAPSETIELVDAVIAYCEVIDLITGSTSTSLNDLIEARSNYSGPGIRR